MNRSGLRMGVVRQPFDRMPRLARSLHGLVFRLDRSGALYVRARDRPYRHVPVWMTGVIRAQAHPNGAGDPGFTMQATIIGPYRDPA